MTVKNVYGAWMDTEKPVTGVQSMNTLPEWVYDNMSYNSIDLDYENHVRNRDMELANGLIDQEEYDQELESWENESPTLLIGDWIKDDRDLYYPDPKGEYAAIVRETEIQVVFSKNTKRCNHCSPCFPGQADLDSDGDFLAYCLPE